MTHSAGVGYATVAECLEILGELCEIDEVAGLALIDKMLADEVLSATEPLVTTNVPSNNVNQAIAGAPQ